MADISGDHIAASGGTFEPQRTNNFVIEIYGLGPSEKETLILSTQSFDLPQESSEVIPVPFQNVQKKIAGPLTWEACTWTLRDFIDNKTREICVNWRAEVGDPDTDQVGLARNYKKEGKIVLLGPNGAFERTCKLIGVWPSAFNPGTADHEGGEKMTMELTLEIDKAKWDKPYASA